MTTATPEPDLRGRRAPTGALGEPGEFEARHAALARQVRVRLTVDRAVAALLPLVLWQVLAMTWSGGKWISSPVEVALRVWSMAGDGSLWLHTWETLKEAIVGLVSGVAVGVVVGVVLGSWRRLSDAVDPVIMGFYSLPRVSLAPLFIIWLGIGLFAKVALVASIVLFNVREGVRGIDREVVDAFRSMNASRRAMVRYVLVPSLVPWLLAAVRIGIGMALIGAVVGEMVGSARGLGWYVMHTSGVYDIAGSITALVVLMILAMIFNATLALLERRMLHWRRGIESWTGQ